MVGDRRERDITVGTMLKHRKIRSRGYVDFVVDTGSQITLLSETTRQKLQIKKSSLNYTEQFTGATNNSMNAAKLKNVKFWFKDNEGSVHTFENDVLIPERSNFDLLGLDFVENAEINFHLESVNSLNPYIEF